MRSRSRLSTPVTDRLHLARSSDLVRDRAALEALLDFHVEAGVDCALDETPHDRFAEASAPRRRPRPAPPAPAPSSERRRAGRRSRRLRRLARSRPPRTRASGRERAATLARGARGAAGRLRGLRAQVQRQEPVLLRRQPARPASCSSAKRRAPTRTASASPSWAAPANSSTACSPPSASTAPQVYIANIVPWRPPGNRDADARRRSRSASRSSSGRSSSPTRTSWSASAAPRRADAARRQGRHPAHPRALVPLPDADGARSARSRRCTRPICCASPLQKRLAWRDFRALRARARRKTGPTRGRRALRRNSARQYMLSSRSLRLAWPRPTSAAHEGMSPCAGTISEAPTNVEDRRGGGGGGFGIPGGAGGLGIGTIIVLGLDRLGARHRSAHPDRRRRR